MLYKINITEFKNEIQVQWTWNELELHGNFILNSKKLFLK